ncbi:hypothetical protein DICA1_B14862 [Diutina catenulata]
MRFSSLLALASATLAFDVNGHPYTQPTWWFKTPGEVPDGGYTQLEGSMRFEPDSRPLGYYAATNFMMENKQIHYFGLWDGNKARWAFFGNDVTIPPGFDDICEPEVDHGPGLACMVRYKYEPGHWYTFNSGVKEDYPDGSKLWEGTVTNDKGEKTVIGSAILGTSVGGAGSQSSLFLEWFPFNNDRRDPKDRECILHAKATFHYPKTDGETARFDYVSDYTRGIADKCAVAEGEPNCRFGNTTNENEMWFEAGFMEDKTPSMWDI